MTVGEALPFALLGGVLGLDVVSFPQAMWSRPIVAATLGGALAGDVGGGLLVGATLELIALETLPFGASRYPEWGSAAVIGGAIGGRAGDSHEAGTLALAILCALAAAMISGLSMVMLRRLNGRWARRTLRAREAGERRAVVGVQLAGLSADFVRGAVLTGVALLLLSPVARAAVATWGVDARLSRAVVVGAALTVAAGAVWKIFHSTAGALWLFGAGLAAAFLVRL